MPSVTSSIDIAVQPEAVWALMCDPHRYPDLVPATHHMLDEGTGTFDVGYVYKEYGGVAPFIGENEWTVTEFEPTRNQSHLGDDGKVRMPLDIDLQPVDSGTRLTITFGLKPRWFLAAPFALLWPIMMRRRTQRTIDETVANAKRLVEADVSQS